MVVVVLVVVEGDVGEGVGEAGAGLVVASSSSLKKQFSKGENIVTEAFAVIVSLVGVGPAVPACKT